MRPVCLLLICLVLAPTASGQARGGARIAGQVTNAESGAGLPDVHVFISGTTAGTTSDEEGRFLLDAVPLGANRIVVSRVGYGRQAHDVVVRRPISFSMDFSLEPRVVDLEEIVITGELDPNWETHLTDFRRGFLGMTDRAAESEIRNPEVLSFRNEGGIFIAEAEGPVIVENRATGYRILYFLRTFEKKGDETRQEGEALFTELLPSSDEERERWDRARRDAYLGSSRHLFRQLFHAETKDAGFFLYAASRPRAPRHAAAWRQNQAAPIRAPQFALQPEELTSAGPSARERYLAFPRYIEVVYTKENETRAYRTWQGLPEPVRDDYQRSWLTLTRDSVLVDSDGGVLDAYGVVYYGHMAFERLADLVPKEYVPPSTAMVRRRR